jgi:hypothetical protein
MGDGRRRNRISRLVSFKNGARPETLPLPADNSARSRAGTGSEAGELEEATLGLNKRMTLQWLRAAQARFRPIKAKVIG